MTAVMARIRVTIDTEEVYKRAFHSAASIAGMTPQEFFEKLITENCADDLERARAAVEGKAPEGKPTQKPPKK